MKRRWPKLMEGTTEERVASFHRLLDEKTAEINTRFKMAPDFVRYAVLGATHSALFHDLMKMHRPKEYSEEYSEWNRDEALLWLSEKLWITALNTGGINESYRSPVE